MPSSQLTMQLKDLEHSSLNRLTRKHIHHGDLQLVKNSDSAGNRVGNPMDVALWLVLLWYLFAV